MGVRTAALGGSFILLNVAVSCSIRSTFVAPVCLGSAEFGECLIKNLLQMLFMTQSSISLFPILLLIQSMNLLYLFKKCFINFLFAFEILLNSSER